jgi:uncharacterized protein (DUF2267 family)
MDRGDRRMATAAGATALGAAAYFLVRRRASRTRLRLAVPTRPPSPELERLFTAAGRSGVDPVRSRLAARVVLVTLLECLPPVERVRLLAALPGDVRHLAAWSRRRTWQRRQPGTLAEFPAAVAERSGLPGPAAAAPVTSSVLAALHQLAGPEAALVGAALPTGLRPAWTGTSATPRFLPARPRRLAAAVRSP